MAASSSAARDAVAFPLVLVEWVDSSHVGTGWTSFEELEGSEESLSCLSAGFLVRDTGEALLLVPNLAGVLDPDNLQAHGSIVIPTCAVVSRRILREVR